MILFFNKQVLNLNGGLYMGKRKTKCMPEHRKPYKERENKKDLLDEIYVFTEAILELENVAEKFKRQTLDKILWNVTELDVKYRCRYRSIDAYNSDEKTEDEKVQHEHVVTKKYLIQKMLDFPKLYKDILNIAVSCLVTKEEHKRLHKVEKEHKNEGIEGWERYKKAKIKVKDMVTGEIVDLDELIASQKLMLDELIGR